LVRSVRGMLVRIAGGPARRLGRRVLPEGVKRRLIDFIAAAEPLPPEPGPYALAQCPALLPGGVFDANRVVLVNNALAWGGAERQVVNLLQGLNGSGLHAELLCLRLGDTPDHDFYRPLLNGASVHNAMTIRQAEGVLRKWSWSERKRITETIRWLPADVRAEILRFLAEFLTIRPYVVHAWQDAASIAAGFAAQLAGVPRIVLSSRNVNPSHFAYHRPYMAPAYRQLMHCPQIIFVNNSEFGCQDYANWLQMGADRLRVHRNGVDLRHMKQADPARIAELARALRIPGSAQVVGSIFRFYEEKQPLLWLDMAAIVRDRMPETHFVVFGVGPLRAEFERRAETLGFGGQMHYPGTTDDASLALQLFAVFVLTSKHEGTPNVVLEASTLGVPVVSTCAGGASESILPGRTGLLAEHDDPREIAGLVIEVLSDPGWTQRARSNGPEFVQRRFGLGRMIDEALDMYDLQVEGR
jgi:glycosyltransferase involved in cell wall biosynthesis